MLYRAEVNYMHFNIYVDDNVGIKLNKLAKTSGKTRNALIREAIEEWINNQVNPQWPDQILSFNGIENFPSFESYRKDVNEPKEDPFE